MPEVKDCTTCAHGVEWWRENGHLLGRCLWECPVPHPRNWGLSVLFSELTEPEKDCPAWKREHDSHKLQSRQQWKENYAEYRKRRDAEYERLRVEYEAKYGKLGGSRDER